MLSLVGHRSKINKRANWFEGITKLKSLKGEMTKLKKNIKAKSNDSKVDVNVYDRIQKLYRMCMEIIKQKQDKYPKLTYCKRQWKIYSQKQAKTKEWQLWLYYSSLQSSVQILMMKNDMDQKASRLKFHCSSRAAN